MAHPLFEIRYNAADDADISSETISSCAGKDDISYFYPSRAHTDSSDATADSAQFDYVKQIREFLADLTKSSAWDNFNSQISDFLMSNIFPQITEQNDKITQSIERRSMFKQQLQTAITDKSERDAQVHTSIFARASAADSPADKEQRRSEQLSYFAIQSLTSILLILIKSAEKNDPTIVQQILALTSQLCEQLPMNSLASKNTFLYKSLEPLTAYIHGLSSTSDASVAKQATRILLSFTAAKGSFSDMLPLLSKLIFNTSDIYSARGLVAQLNDGLKDTLVDWEKRETSENETEDAEAQEKPELPSLVYLKLINAYPNEQLTHLDEDVLTGQLLSAIILSHLDIDNAVYSPVEHFKLSSMSSEFHSSTLKELFRIIEQLSAHRAKQSTPTIVQILTVCLRLWSSHLQVLADHPDNVSTYASDVELKNWFELLFTLSCLSQSEETAISKAASKAFLHVVNIRTPVFAEKLTLLHGYIVEDKHSTLIAQIRTELARVETLSSWIDSLCAAETKQAATDILVWFVDRCFAETTSPAVETLLFSFQKLLFYRLKECCEKKTPSTDLSALLADHLTRVLKKCVSRTSLESKMLVSALAGLHLMTNAEDVAAYESVQPIFLATLPLLAQCYLQNLDNDYLGCLLSKISHALIVGPPQDPLEEKHLNKLKQTLFAGGGATDRSDYLLKSALAAYSQFQLPPSTNDEQDFLMSVYNNTGDGERLLCRLKASLRNKPHLLQKSIEQQANDACAAIFAVYLKLYRRINLATAELAQSELSKPYPQLLAIYEYAHAIQSVFATIKGQGGDCAELHRQIKLKSMFLLTSVKASDLIAIVEADPPSPAAIDYKVKPGFHRQRSRWSKARHVLKILRNLFQACIRFKRFMLEKKQSTEQKHDYESLLHRTIDNFIYGDFYKTSASSTPEEKQAEIDELERCLARQHERAMIRLITYRFIRTFFSDVLKEKENEQARTVLSICLPQIKGAGLDWSYFDNIPAANNQLREEISNTYYSVVKLVLPFATQSAKFAPNIFFLLNLPYGASDIDHLYANQIVEQLFHAFVSSAKNDDAAPSVGLKLMAYNWFRLFVFKLCETVRLDKLRDPVSQTYQQLQKFVFNTLIFNEVKSLRSAMDGEEPENARSLKDVAINWFLQMNEKNESKSNLCINQYLALLLQSMHSYKSVRSACATVDYLQELLDIYHHQKSSVTRLLAIKFLRYLIPSIADYADGVPRRLIEVFLAETLTTIGDNTVPSEITAELISMYRAVMSVESVWTNKAIALVRDSIQSHLNVNAIESNASDRLIRLRASLNIMGAYLEPYRLGAIVHSEPGKSVNDDSPLALILEINETETPYLIEFLQSKQTTSMTADQLQMRTELPPTRPLTTFASLLDTLGAFISIESTADASLLMLELKRCSLAVLHHLLSENALIESFMQTPYASVLARLCLDGSHQRPANLRVLDRRHLQQYSLSLDRCELLKETTDEQPPAAVQSPSASEPAESLYTTWKSSKTPRDPLLVESLSSPSIWRPYVPEAEMEYFRQGYIGNEEISIVAMPRSITTGDVLQECGVKHRYRGRIAPSYESISVSFPTFVVNGLQLTEGNWYYCVRLPVGGVFQIGWATTDFAPSGGCGVGDDKYSWSYDGSRAVLFYEQGHYSQFNDIRWKENDVCGCGIEIDGKNTKIKYWLNGKLLGTGFEHDKNIPLTATKCNLLPHGPSTIFYPALTIQWTTDPPRCCEIIVSPEDMQDCPLPSGYKPLLMPKSILAENAIVDYPFSAYLVGDDQEDFFVDARSPSASKLLRDFVNERHLPTTLACERNRLILPENDDSFILSMHNDEVTSLTISFNFQLTARNEKSPVRLFTLDSTEITWDTTSEQVHCVVLLLSKRRHLKVYVNNECRTFADVVSYETTRQLSMHLLPGTAAEMNNLAVWKYALPEEQIDRLFTYGVSYVVADYKRIKDYRKRANGISFSADQQAFVDATLVPFDAPFDETVWEEKKKQAADDESRFFKAHTNAGYSTVELLGNKTYLVLDKSDSEWSQYTLSLELSIPQWPVSEEKLALVVLNVSSTILVNSDGKLVVESEGTNHTSNSSVVCNQYFRLTVCVQHATIQLYCNNKLDLNAKFTDEQLQIDPNHIALFKETDPTKNTTSENALRVSLKSLTYLDRVVPIEQIPSPALLFPPLSVISSNLTIMGYKQSWMKTIVERQKPADLTALHTLLREQKQQLIKSDAENARRRFSNLLSRLDASFDEPKSNDLIGSANLASGEQLTGIAERLAAYWSSSPPSHQNKEFEGKIDTNWFTKAVEDLDADSNVNRWIRDGSSSGDTDDDAFELFDLQHADQQSSSVAKESLCYSHKTLSPDEYRQSRTACEQGLATVYARHTILNMLEVWSHNATSRFPLEKFGDYSFLIGLLKLLDSTKISSNEKTDRVHLLLQSILRSEVKQVFASANPAEQLDLLGKAPLLYHLQKDLIIRSLESLFRPALQNHPSNHNFTFKTLVLFSELITEKTTLKKHQIELLVPALFPPVLINLIFHLFLVVSSHQWKIAIIQLFTMLLQISGTTVLNGHIQKFLAHLLLDLSAGNIPMSNAAKKKLGVALVDFVCVLLRKQNKDQPGESKHMPEFLSKLSEKIRHLFTISDVVDAWLDPNKQAPLPDEFFVEAKNVIEEKYKVTQEDFRQSNSEFSASADHDLINFMNNNSLLNDSFSRFIDSLPTDVEASATSYKNHLSLTAISPESVRLRAKLVYVLNKCIENSLLLLDLNAPQGRSYLTDQIRRIKSYLLSSTKLTCLHESLDKTETNYSSDYPSIHFDTVKASTDADKSENTMFYQAYQQMHANAHQIFRRPNEQLWQAQYTGMHSTDSGGPYRDSITRICMDICSTRLPLFVLCPNGRMNSGSNRDCWIPNTFPLNKTLPKKIKRQYRFVGQLLGMAIRKKHYLDLKFPVLVWKKLLREQITVDDVEAVDMQSFRIINEMEKNIEQIKSMQSTNDVESVFSSIMSELRFDVVSSSGQTYELLPGGSEVAITASNFKQYCSLYRQYRLTEFNRQIDCIWEGLSSVVPSYYLSLFTANELEEAACGKGRIDMELLKRNTTYSYEYNAETPSIVHFWTVLEEMFTDEQRKLFLIFVWGRSTLPIRDEDFSNKFNITKLDTYGEEEVDKTLPRSHTCFFTIDLPAYSTSDVTYERLNYAITCCSSIDGDGAINDAPDAIQTINDESLFD